VCSKRTATFGIGEQEGKVVEADEPRAGQIEQGRIGEAEPERARQRPQSHACERRQQGQEKQPAVRARRCAKRSGRAGLTIGRCG